MAPIGEQMQLVVKGGAAEEIQPFQQQPSQKNKTETLFSIL